MGAWAGVGMCMVRVQRVAPGGRRLHHISLFRSRVQSVDPEQLPALMAAACPDATPPPPPPKRSYKEDFMPDLKAAAGPYASTDPSVPGRTPAQRAAAVASFRRQERRNWICFAVTMLVGVIVVLVIAVVLTRGSSHG